MFHHFAVQDIVRRYKEAHDTWEEFPEKVAFQMNDTHPTLMGELHCCNSMPQWSTRSSRVRSLSRAPMCRPCWCV